MFALKNKSDRYLAAVMFVAVCMLLTLIISGWRQHVTQTNNLAVVRVFIEEYGKDLRASFPSVNDLHEYTGGGGCLGILHDDSLAKDDVRLWVNGKNDSVKIVFIRSSVGSGLTSH